MLYMYGLHMLCMAVYNTLGANYNIDYVFTGLCNVYTSLHGPSKIKTIHVFLLHNLQILYG